MKQTRDTKKQDSQYVKKIRMRRKNLTVINVYTMYIPTDFLKKKISSSHPPSPSTVFTLLVLWKKRQRWVFLNLFVNIWPLVKKLFFPFSHSRKSGDRGAYTFWQIWFCFRKFCNFLSWITLYKLIYCLIW